jgi:hypothetical protein
MNNEADALTPRSRGAIGKDRRSETPRSGYTKIKPTFTTWGNSGIEPQSPPKAYSDVKVNIRSE